METVLIKRLSKSAIVPVKQTVGSAGVDLHADLCHNVQEEEIPAGQLVQLLVPAGCTAKVGTGIAVQIPEGYFGAIFARSGLAAKKGLRPANCVGVIDSDYRGEVIVALHNDSEEAQFIYHEDRIAQLVLIPYPEVSFEEVEELDDTIRGRGGFGSTDKVMVNSEV